MKFHNWLLEKSGRIAYITLNRETSLNSINLETLGELKQLSEDISKDKEIWAVVLQAAGKHFSAGMDVEIISQKGNELINFKKTIWVDVHILFRD